MPDHDRKFCPRCKTEQIAQEKLWCWICHKCRIIVAHKPGTLADVLEKIKEQKNAIKERKQSEDNK